MDHILILGTLIFDPIAALCIFVALLWDYRLSVVPSWHRFGLTMCAIGLLGQGYRSYVTVVTGIAPRDDEIAYWVLKDYGLVVLAFCYLASLVRRSRVK